MSLEEEYKEYLRKMEFKCSIDAIEEGTIVYPNEPLLRVRGPIIQVQLLETTLLNIINFQTLIATKSADGVIIGCGRTGTLNEFTIAFETKIPIGVLQGTGGTADFIDDILKQGHRPLTKIIYGENPKKGKCCPQEKERPLTTGKKMTGDMPNSMKMTMMIMTTITMMIR